MESIDEKKERAPIDSHQEVIQLGEVEFRKLVIALFREGRDRMNDLETLIHANTKLTEENAKATAELVSIFQGAKTGAAAFAWLGRNLRRFVQFIYPFALLAGVIGAIWHGKWPKWGE